MKYALAIAAALVSLSAPASAQIYGQMNAGVTLGAGIPAPYYAPPPVYQQRGGYYEEGYAYRGGGYDYRRRRLVRIEPQGLGSRRYRCDAATTRPAEPGNAWCDPH